jgi:hypothetical protein
VKSSDLIRLYPNVFHMAADGSWPSIERHGLLSTASVLDRWDISPAASERLLTERRDASEVLEHPVHGIAIVRDQKPLDVKTLSEILVDMTVSEWCGILNERVFFFLQPEGLHGLLNAKSYKASAHTVITLDTASLVAMHEDRIELCRMNSGNAQPHSRGERGRGTFKSIAQYPHPDRDVAKWSARPDVRELSVLSGVPDIRDHVVRVDRMQQSVVLERIV